MENFVDRWAAFWAAPDPDRVEELAAAGITLQYPGLAEPLRGVAAWRAQVASIVGRFPDVRLAVTAHATAGDLCFVSWRGTGTAAGRTIVWQGIDRMRLRDGLVTESLGRLRYRWIPSGIIGGMSLLAVIYLSPVLFIVACGWRLVAGRSMGRGVGGRYFGRLAASTLLAAVFGTVLIMALAAVLVANYHRELRKAGALGGVQTAALTIGAYLVVVPIINWLGMRRLGVRPAGLAAFGSWALLGTALLLVQRNIPGGVIQPAWFYGLVAPVPYAVAAAAVACVPEYTELRSVGGSTALGGTEGGGAGRKGVPKRRW